MEPVENLLLSLKYTILGSLTGPAQQREMYRWAAGNYKILSSPVTPFHVTEVLDPMINLEFYSTSLFQLHVCFLLSCS